MSLSCSPSAAAAFRGHPVVPVEGLRGMRYFIERARELGVLDTKGRAARELTGAMRRVPNELMTRIMSYLELASGCAMVRSSRGLSDRAFHLYRGTDAAVPALLKHCGDDVSKLTADERDRLIQLGPYARSLTSSYDKLRKLW